MQPASSRAYEKVTIQCGLLNVPAEVYSGMASKSGISRKMFTGENADHEVGYSLVDKVTGDVVERSNTVKKVDTEYGFVFVEDSEIEQLFNIFPKTVTIKSFHPLSEWEGRELLGETLYFVEPVRTSRKVSGKTVKSVDPSSHMALSLLLKAMQDEGKFALVEWVSRGTPKPAVLLPDGQLWSVYYDEELREQRPVDIADNLPATAVEQARALVQAMTSDEIPVLSDEYSAKIQAFADDKAASGDFTKPVEAEVSAPAQVFDLEAMLKASVDAAKKAS